MAVNRKPSNIREPIICPFCKRNQDLHSWGPIKDYCSFRFASPADLLEGSVLLIWQNGELIRLYTASERGYAMALIAVEQMVNHHRQFTDESWRIIMERGFLTAEGPSKIKLETRAVIS